MRLAGERGEELIDDPQGGWSLRLGEPTVGCPEPPNRGWGVRAVMGHAHTGDPQRHGHE